MKILLSAFACIPGAGSESGHGWNYPKALAKRGHEIHVIVPQDCQNKVTEQLSLQPIPNLIFHYVGHRNWTLKLGRILSSVLRYLFWQWDASNKALQIDSVYNFDLVHHLSYGSLMGGSFLWRLKKPFIYGPCGGGQIVPSGFEKYLGKVWLSENLRSLLVKNLWRMNLPALKTIRSSQIILASNSETAVLAKKMGAKKVDRLLDVYLPDEVLPSAFNSRNRHEITRLLWVGRFFATKALPLAVEALQKVPASVPIHLEVIGGGPLEKEFKSWLKGINLVHQVDLRGMLPWKEALSAYDNADIFLFTGLRDTVGIQLLEAMSHGLPIIAPDHQGAAELVNDETGIKIPVTNPDEMTRNIANAIEWLASSSDLRMKMGLAGYERAKQFSLSKRIDAFEKIYNSILSPNTFETDKTPKRMKTY